MRNWRWITSLRSKIPKKRMLKRTKKVKMNKILIQMKTIIWVASVWHRKWLWTERRKRKRLNCWKLRLKRTKKKKKKDKTSQKRNLSLLNNWKKTLKRGILKWQLEFYVFCNFCVKATTKICKITYESNNQLQTKSRLEALILLLMWATCLRSMSSLTSIAIAPCWEIKLLSCWLSSFKVHVGYLKKL